MKDYSIYDLKKGDIYEHHAGGLYQVKVRNPKDRQILGVRVNDTHAPDRLHEIRDVKLVYFQDL